MPENPASSQGDNLIFLVSQPRAGSTLLQRILGSHPEIHTLPEPWIMLTPLYSHRKKGVKFDFAPYRPRKIATQTFLEQISGEGEQPEQHYYASVRQMCGYLYAQALKNTPKTRFLDKTPRYYHIIPEIHTTFPDAKFIFLVRNPLAVLFSNLSRWSAKHWFGLACTARRHDLLTAPGCLLAGMECLGPQGIVVRYEDVVTSPERELQRLADFLKIAFKPEILTIEPTMDRWQIGDHHNVYRYTSPVPNFVDKWVQGIQNPQMWRACADYLALLGPDVVNCLGYDYTELQNILDQHKPPGLQRVLTLSLQFLLTPKHERSLLAQKGMKLSRKLKFPRR